MGGEPIALGKPEKRRAKVSGGAVALAIVLGVLGYLSYRPTTRLRPDPPASFLETRKEWDARRRAIQERAARAYWEQALEEVQVKYSYETPLPTEAPPEFSIEKKGFPLGSPEASPAVRALYWERLRAIWTSPQAWETSYEWSMAWVSENLVSFEQAILRSVNTILGQFNK
ncbi:MAG: hypothetical protein LAN62_19150 [Acidobacteriia bacterium]|nr:hypothetical protein [Terriglobia bacterium]